MPDSSLSSYTSRPAFLAGLDFAARRQAVIDAAERRRAEQEAQIVREKQREQAQLRNQMALKSFEWQHEAEETKRKAPIEFRKNFVEKNLAAYRANIAARYSDNEEILKPENAGKLHPETIQSARKQNAALENLERDALTSQPTDYTKPIDLSLPWMKPLPVQVPIVESNEAKAVRQAKLEKEQLDIEKTEGDIALQPLRANQIRASTAASNRSNRGGAGSLQSVLKAQAKDFAKGLGSYNGFLSSAPLVDTPKRRMLSMTEMASRKPGMSFSRGSGNGASGPQFDPIQVTKANAQYAVHAPAFVSAMTNPHIVGSDGAQYVKAHAPKFNYLSTGPDFWNFQAVIQDDMQSSDPTLKATARDLWTLMNSAIPDFGEEDDTQQVQQQAQPAMEDASE